MIDDEYGGWVVEICHCGWSTIPRHERSIAVHMGRKHWQEHHPDAPQDKKLTCTIPYALVQWLEEVYGP